MRMMSCALVRPLQAAAGMARPQTDGGVESSGQSGQQSCRMEALRPEGARQDAWHRGGFHAPQTACQPRLPRRDIATQTAYSAVAHSPRPMPVPVPSAPPSGITGTPGPERTGKGLRREEKAWVLGSSPTLCQFCIRFGQVTDNNHCRCLCIAGGEFWK